MGKPKSKCCKKFRKKGKACSNCPLMVGLSKQERRKRIERLNQVRKGRKIRKPKAAA